MKIQCDSCGKAEAEVLCCADEAVLCLVCAESVHAANSLSSKHRRVSLVKHPPCHRTDQSPPCDICQDKKGYIFCLEDRALLCRNCDMGTHNAKPYTSAHRRFLITGVRVALNSSSSSSSPALGLGQVQTREGAETLQVNRDMNLAEVVSSMDTPADFSYLESPHTATDRLGEHWPAVTFDYSYDFSDMKNNMA